MMNTTGSMDTDRQRATDPPRAIYAVIKVALVKRGWRIADDAAERPSGEPFEFVHPRTGECLPWTEALLTQHFDLESD
jgi:hypothetical protein